MQHTSIRVIKGNMNKALKWVKCLCGRRRRKEKDNGNIILKMFRV
jgi:hypothetical protein